MKFMHSSLIRLSMAVLVPMSSILGGCTHTYEKKIARFEPGGEKLMSIVPRTGVYSVKWTRNKASNLRDLDGTQMLLYKGEAVGFETQEDGTVVAIGGQRRIVLDRLPDNARYTVWHGKSKEKTHFRREFDKAMETTSRIAVGSAIVIGGGLLMGVGFYGALKADDRDQSDGYRRR